MEGVEFGLYGLQKVAAKVTDLKFFNTIAYCQAWSA